MFSLYAVVPDPVPSSPVTTHDSPCHATARCKTSAGGVGAPDICAAA
jgi:hypothetical protein